MVATARTMELIESDVDRVVQSARSCGATIEQLFVSIRECWALNLREEAERIESRR